MAGYEFLITSKTQSLRPPLIQLFISQGLCRLVRCVWRFLVVGDRFFSVVSVVESGFSVVLGSERLQWINTSSVVCVL
jgi:hypothetical protein